MPSVPPAPPALSPARAPGAVDVAVAVPEDADGPSVAAAIGELRSLGCRVHVVDPEPQPELRPESGATAPAPYLELTPREREVLELVAVGCGTPAICARLHIAPSTMRSHLRSVFWKLGAHSRVEAVAQALGRGLVDPPI